MPRPHPVGTRRETIPIPPVEAHLTRIPAGAVDFGVEYRRLDDAIISAHVANHPDTAELVADAREQNGTANAQIDEQGVSIHVFDAGSGLEYLRFDAFVNDPHYHYITPGSHHVDVGYDETAQGDYVTWIMTALEQRLSDMLLLAGAPELAGSIDHDTITASLAVVRTVVAQTVGQQPGPALASELRVSIPLEPATSTG